MLGLKMLTVISQCIDFWHLGRGDVLDFALFLLVLLENDCRMDGGEDDEIILWNEIATDFDPEEETANFGTRRALEADGNLYEVGNGNSPIETLLAQVTTLATIDPSSTPSTLPTTLGSASHNAVTVAIDSVLAIFSPDCQSVTPLQFECSIQTFAVSPCNRFGNAKTTMF